MNITTGTPPLIFLAGHWLGAWAWDDLLAHLPSTRTIALTLPGLDPDDPDRTSRAVDDQAAAIIDLLARLDSPAVVVAHSGANAPLSVVLDRHPQLVRRVVWVDSGPWNGRAFAPELPVDVRELALPPFDVLAQQASLAGLTPDLLERFRARAVAEPAPVLRQAVELTNDLRHDVPTTLVCCSLPSAQVHELADAGHPMFADVARLTRVESVDLPTGHWPMWSRPSDLAAVILAAARQD
ncbi:predicted hydrolase or acyltransferase [Microbacterium testaceum StLB037]|uniref:Predicted hydrolase or acyltransferase n=1 Tax=Microbacterium testaceum (strain StLB037) TaxID=979556 RepID=E8NB22_MICTS|nr:alpha/beta hydrolase [Microbacterium testaceum]BAJ73444.1 predicted hydrolase or acyltransferase [Microbacterium testaceum StLB037]